MCPRVKPTLKWSLKSLAKVCANLGLDSDTGVGSLTSIQADGLLSALPLGSMMMVSAMLSTMFFLRSCRRTLSCNLLFNP